MKISVIIPAYNVEKYINRSINSVLKQTYKPFEIILVNDGSTDHTEKLIKDYKDEVRYISQTNQGSSSARNHGIVSAKGNWIAFLDSDDEWIETHLENFIKTHKLYPEIKWYGAPFKIIDEESKKAIFKIEKGHSNQIDKHVIFDDYMGVFPPRGYLSSPTMIIHKSVFDKVGYFDLTKKTAVDLDMWFRIGLEFAKIGYTYKEGAIVYHRKFSLSTSKAWNPTKPIKRFEDCENMAKELGLNYIIRVEPRIIYWVKKFINDCIIKQDVKALKEIKEKYYSRLTFKYKGILILTTYFPFLLNIIKKLKSY
jgi:glycosyltransferase involved in cell wall biosynthesis|tara:strand:+ start:2513 stop:3442 length:930 start_codon:yes stop_codon:yes gene_type:complete